jgi:hypothetical protein
VKSEMSYLDWKGVSGTCVVMKTGFKVS